MGPPLGIEREGLGKSGFALSDESRSAFPRPNPRIVFSFFEAARRIDWNGAIGTIVGLILVWADDNPSFSVLTLQYYWLLSDSRQRRGSA